MTAYQHAGKRPSARGWTSGWLARADVRARDPADAGKSEGPRRLDVDLGEAGAFERGDVRVARDRSRDAAGPQVEPLLRRGAELLERDHVRDRETPTGPQEPERLAQHRALVRREVDDAVGDD